ncbi:YfhD family protein [Priestia filamentosa]|nr:YfhD family protein [Priestia filamentosa]MDT3762649.1 YfhD family protein [Priestia filamentosa]WCM17714.1 YfhD family protein [Priestia filamentosa]WRU97111.1 YfhD family protein [Priestia filamentosa]SMF29329.1 YfhD-like protein [Priestia filamentosa]
MTRGQSKNNKHKNKAKLSQTPKSGKIVNGEFADEITERTKMRFKRK